MPVQPISLLIPSLLGDAQSQSGFLLSAAYSPGGSTNLYIDKLGKIRSIKGYHQHGSFTVGVSPAVVRALVQHRKISLQGTLRQVLMWLDNGYDRVEMHVSTDLGMTATSVIGFGPASVGQIPDFAHFGEDLFFVNGVISPRFWNGQVVADTASNTQLLPPVTFPTPTTGPLTGNYRHRVVPMRSVKDRKVSSAQSAVIQVTNAGIQVTWIPDVDTTVIGYEVYRTSGTGMDYYFVAYVDGRTTSSYTDTLPDLDLILRTAMAMQASVGDPPPVGTRHIVAHKGRMFWMGTDTYPRRFWWSDPGDADSVYQDRHYAECSAGEQGLGDELMGGMGEYEGMIVFFLRNSVWTMSGTGMLVGDEIDWRLRRTDARVGTPSIRTVLRVPTGASYTDQDGQLRKTQGNMLVYLTMNNDIRLFDGQNDLIISYPKADTLKQINRAQMHKAYAYDDQEHGMYVWVIPPDQGNETEPLISVVWNYWYGTWHEWRETPFGHVIRAESDRESIYLAGETRISVGAKIYQLWADHAFDGAPITGTLMTKPIYPPMEQGGEPDLSHEKRLNDLFLLFDRLASPLQVTVGFFPHDAGDYDPPVFVRTITGSTRVKVPARQPETSPYAGRYHHGVGWRVMITATAATGDWALNAIEQVYQGLLGQTR